MSKREKILAACVGLVAVAFFTYLAIHRVFLLPAAQRFNQANELVTRLERAYEERAKETTYRARLKELAGRTFGSDELKVSEQVRSRITAILAQSGLSSEKLTLKPLMGARVPGIYKEIGWMVQIRGGLQQIVDFLYLMTREPHLHRLDNLVLTPTRGTAEVELQVKYGTLVLDAAQGEQLATGTVPEEAEAPGLDTTEHRQYQLIAQRDLFRPYIPAPKSVPDSPTPSPAQPQPPQPPRVPEGRYRVVGLPTWGGRTDVLVRDSASGNVSSYQPGDDLGGGKIIMVDYRPKPLPNRPEIISGSRVVIQVGAEYYAVELGTTLAERYPLAPEQWPPGLPKPQSAAPESGAPESGAASP